MTSTVTAAMGDLKTPAEAGLQLIQLYSMKCRTTAKWSLFILAQSSMHEIPKTSIRFKHVLRIKHMLG